MEPLKNAEILTGKYGLDCEVITVDVMEVPDAIEWFHEGILIITTAYAIKDDPVAQIQFFKGLIDLKAAGIIIKIDRYLKVLPDEVYLLAEQHNFPIISIPNDISFPEMIKPIMQKLDVSSDLNIFKVISEIDFRQDGYKELLEVLEKFLENPVTIEDPNTRLIAHSSSFNTDKWRKSKVLYTRCSPFSHQMIKENQAKSILFDERKTVRIDSDDPELKPRALVPIVYKNETFGIMSIIQEGKMITSTDIQVTEYIASHIAFVISQERINLQGRKEMEKAFVYNLINKEITKKEIELYTDYFNLSLDYIVQAVILDMSDHLSNLLNKGESEIDEVKDLMEIEIYKVANKVFEKALLTTRGNEIMIIGLLQKDDNHQLVEKSKELLENSLAQLKGQFDAKLPIGIGRPVIGLINAKKSLEEAQMALKLGNEIWPNESVYEFEKLGIYRLLTKLKGEEVLDSFYLDTLGPIINHDKNSDLLNTLHCYLQNNGNSKRTTEALFIHRSTLRYRLEKIEELLQIDLDNPDNRLLIQIAFKIERIVK